MPPGRSGATGTSPLKRLRRRVSHLPPLPPAARVLLLFLGGLLVVLGLAQLVLPGPGLLTLLAAAAVLSLVSGTVLLALRALFRRWAWGWRILLRFRRRIHRRVHRWFS